jgi:hypothetical protein
MDMARETNAQPEKNAAEIHGGDARYRAGFNTDTASFSAQDCAFAILHSSYEPEPAPTLQFE